MRRRMFAPVALALLLGGCGGLRVTTDFNTTTDFTRYNTFGWMENTGRTNDPRVSGDLMDQRFRRAIESELAAKGLQKMASGQPDLLVGYQALLDERVDVRTVNTYWGNTWGYRGVYAGGVAATETYASEYTYGTLIIDVFDRSRKELVWRGAGEGRVDAARDPAERQERINEAVYQIFEAFPIR